MSGRLGGLLRGLRLEAGLTQEQLAEQAGLGVRTVQRLETGRARDVRTGTVRRVARVLADTLGRGHDEVCQELLAAHHDAVSAQADDAGRPTPEPDRRSTPVQLAETSFRVPAQLPADIADFTGRHAELRTLTGMLEASSQGRAPRVVAVSGMGGVGKTALAVHAAQSMRHLFPDGQLYVDLHGFGAGPARTARDVLAEFLTDLDGSSGSGIPEHTDDRASLLRSTLAERRVLLVLDNARDSSQVAPLLPGNGRCAVIVTSRNTLTDLPGSAQTLLTTLDVEEQRALLSRLCGPDRIGQDPDGALRILAACAGLPLALRITGARLASRPAWSMTTLAERLDDSRGRLQALSVGQLAVNTTFANSYLTIRDSEDPLEREAARAFRLLGLWAGHTLGVDAAAALLDRPLEHTTDLLELLVDVHLLQTPGPLRYRFHDLLGEYAAERVGEEAPAEERDAARLRLMVWYALALEESCAAMAFGAQDPPALDEAAPAPLPIFGDGEQALRWCAQELVNIREAIRQAAHTSRPDLAWRLATWLYGYARTYWWAGGWDECLDLALRTATKHGDLLGQAWLLRRIGATHGMAFRNEKALEAFHAALALFEKLGDESSEATVLANLCSVHGHKNEPEQALAYARQALEVHGRTGDRNGEIYILGNLGHALGMVKDYSAAEKHLREVLELTRDHGSPTSRAYTLTHLGETLRGLDKREDAFAVLSEALEIRRHLGDISGIVDSLMVIGHTHMHFAQWQQAETYFEEAIDISRENGLEGHAKRGLEDLHELHEARD